MSTVQTNLLVDGLSVETAHGDAVLNNVSLELAAGEICAVVGESGCGKSTLIFAILGLLSDGLHLTSGRILLFGKMATGGLELTGMSSRQRRSVLGRHIGYVPQDCLQGLNPILAVGDTLYEVVRCHENISRQSAVPRIERACVSAGLAPGFLEGHSSRLPGNLSGGQRQRLLVASARMHVPSVVLYDEPTTALDPLAKRRLMETVRADLRDETSALIVSHDLDAMRLYADRVYVLYGGEVVESGPAPAVLSVPEHPYTRALVASVPRVDRRDRPLPIPGRPPQIDEPRRGCRFAARCPERTSRCDSETQQLITIDQSHQVRCHARA